MGVVAKTRIGRIYNTVNIDTWKRTVKNRTKGWQRLGLTEGDFVVLGVGQLEAGKEWMIFSRWPKQSRTFIT